MKPKCTILINTTIYSLLFIPIADHFSFIMHMFTPSPEPNDAQLQCPNCLRMYKTPAKLKAHMKKYCLKEKKYPCFFCEYRSKRRDHIRRHMASIHAEQLVRRQKEGLSMEIKELDDKDGVDKLGISKREAAANDAIEENDDDFDDDYEEESDA